MASAAVSCLLRLLCVVLLPAAGGAVNCDHFWKFGIYANECSHYSYFYKHESTGASIVVIVVSIIGAVLFVVICVTPILCCLCPCCLLYNTCRKKRYPRQQVVVTTNISGDTHPSYQPVPMVQTYGGQHVPTAPPHFYVENNSSPPAPLPLGPGGDLPPPYSEHQRYPYNPSYSP